MKHNGNFQARRPIDDEPTTRHILVVIRHYEPAGGAGAGPLSIWPSDHKKEVVMALENALDTVTNPSRLRTPPRNAPSAFAGVIASAQALPEPVPLDQVNVCTKVLLYEDGALSIRGDCMERWYLRQLFANAIEAVKHHNDPNRPILVPSRDVSIEVS